MTTPFAFARRFSLFKSCPDDPKSGRGWLTSAIRVLGTIAALVIISSPALAQVGK